MNDLPHAARYFSHEAMHTTFRLRFPGIDESYARGVARECFDQIDLLESRLSRFLEGSEISRINALATGETLRISEECHECLLLALEGGRETGGLFDIAIGEAISRRKSGSDGVGDSLKPLGRLLIHPDAAAVTCLEAGRQLDLGGVGKGFALDVLRRLLLEWDISDAFLAAGASSLLAMGSDLWPVDLAGDRVSRRISLRNQSLSASGIGIQGEHIVHPGGPKAMPITAARRIWVVSPTATKAEIWSTALMLVSLETMGATPTRHDSLTTFYCETESGIVGPFAVEH